MDKIKDLASKAKGSGGGSSESSTGSSGGSGGGADKYIDKGVDMATDKAGMGDKYDSKISDQVEKQYDNYSNKK